MFTYWLTRALPLLAFAITILSRWPLNNTFLPRSVNLLTATASDLTNALNSRRFTVTQLIDEYVTRIQKHDKHGLRLNSVMNMVPLEQLRSMAIVLDNERREGIYRSALSGIPILVKDNFATEPSLGLPTTGGVFAFANVTAEKDAPCVHQLRQAGAIIIGKTNLDELASFKGDNLGSGWSKLGGYIRSAYTFESPCGSSGGSAVAVSAGFVPVALGSETAGSITCPASHAALFGFVGSRGLVSNQGLLPASTSFDRPGILSKSTIDLASVLGIIAQPSNPLAQNITSANYTIPGGAVWPDFRIGLADPDFFGEMHDLYRDKSGETKMYEAVTEATRRMGALGAFINMNASFSTAKLIPETWKAMERIIHVEMKSGLADFLAETSNAPVNSLPELVQYNKENWIDALQKDGLRFPQGQEFLEKSVKEQLTDAEYEGIMASLYTLAVTDGIEYAFRTHKIDFLVVPGWSWISVYSSIAGAPMGTVPLGKYPNGQPFGLTFVARKGDDAKLLQLMHLYETAFPSRRVPSSMRSKLENVYYGFRHGL